MRKEETVRVIPERKEVVVTYYGNCPECGGQQISTNDETYVDIMCPICLHKQKEVERQQFLDTYIGARILKIDNRSHEILVIAKTGRIYAITNAADEYDGQCDGCTRIFESEEVKEGDMRLIQLKKR